MLFLPPHPNILQIHEAFDFEDSLTLILDLCEPYTLYDKVIKSNGGLPEPKFAGIMPQLLKVVAHCHRFGVVHRDIKPDNVLFDRMGLDSESGSLLSGVYGTPYYVAPEVLMGRDYGEKVDVWSANVVLYAMLSGIPPSYSIPRLGFGWQFIMLAGFHADALVVDTFAQDFTRKGMLAYVERIQREEGRNGVDTLAHQKWSVANF
ncbi:unnamed protein product [Linum trigynum]|uniref:Protein kinase domain-containing protein n=1 Tax=Linum trigynum TaxID=586398 RepID=A0AAV2EUM0_9ROSI